MKIVKNGKKEIEELSFPTFLPVIYETVRTYGKKPFAFDEHFKRLQRSASYVSIKIPFTSSDLLSILKDLAKETASESYFRIYVEPGGDFYIEAKELKDLLKSERVTFSPIRKAPESSIPAQLKIVSRTDIMLARVLKGDFYDALMLSSSGFLAEGSFSNVFLVKDDVLVTPSIETGILDGITRKYTIELAKSLGIKVVERLVHPWEVFQADEIFLTHTSREIVPVKEIGGKTFKAPGKITKLLKEKFKEFAAKP